MASLPSLAGLSFPVKRSPVFSTARYEAVSGKRTTAPKQTFPRWQWALPYSFLRSAAYGRTGFTELEQLIGFFNARSADGLVFTYEDAEDNTAVNAGFGTGDGVTTAFQLYRAYGGFSEPIFSAVPTSVSVNGVPTAAYSLGTTGIVTFDVAPGNALALTWSGTFKFLCRFDQDSLDLQMIMKGLHEAASPVSFSSELNITP